MDKIKYLIFSLIIVITSIISVSSNAENYNGINNYNLSVYDSDKLKYYYKDCNIDTSVFNINQVRINNELYGQSSLIYSKDHFDYCYGDVDTALFASFRKYASGLIPMSFSIAEWGGHNDISFSFTPAIASRDLKEVGLDSAYLRIQEVNSVFYAGNGIEFNDRSYWGPLQINNNYLNPNVTYKCGYIPLDYYSWADSCQWTMHNQCELIKRSWNSSYTFNNEYDMLSNLSIAHNSGGNHISSRSSNIDQAWYPWRSSSSVWDYSKYLSSDEVLAVILGDADKYTEDIKYKIKNNLSDGSLYLSVNDCRERIVSKLNIDWSMYVKDKWLDNMNSGIKSNDSSRNWEKVCYPIQIIWNYRVLKNLYGII